LQSTQSLHRLVTLMACFERLPLVQLGAGQQLLPLISGCFEELPGSPHVGIGRALLAIVLLEESLELRHPGHELVDVTLSLAPLLP
jgi:hypothetical protein